MARTKKTQPWWVRVEKQKHRMVPVHRCGGSVSCTLPKAPIVVPEPWQVPCYWTPRSRVWQEIYGTGPSCLCCGLKPDPKRKRREGRKYSRDGWRNEY